MPPTEPRPAGDEPRIIRLRPARDPAAFHAAVSRLAAAARARVAEVTVCLDVAEAHAPEADPQAVAGPLGQLLDAACAAAAAPAPRGESPTLREVVVTTIDTGDALEIEVADSAADPSRQRAAVADLRPLVERAGWGLSLAACPDGGTAVTLRIPRRRGRSLAA
jgi:hypothetical protein